MRLHRTVATALALLALLARAHPALAQAPSDSAERASTGWDIQPSIGVARHSPVGYDWGIMADRSHLFVGVDLRATVLHLGRVRLYYAPSLTPLLVLSHDRSDGSSEPQRSTAHGAGVAPFGVGLGVALTPRVSIFGASRVGFIQFDRVIPVPNAATFNVTLEWGAELEWRSRTGRALTVGYKFHHLSNVYTAMENPGVDANVFTAGYGWHWRGPRRR